MRKQIAFILFIPFILSSFILSCAAQKEPMPIPAQEIISEKTQVVETEAAEWDRLVSEARKEKRVEIYSTVGVEPRMVLTELFKEKFNVSPYFLVGKGGEISAKLLSERAAGLYLADLYLGGATTLVTELKPAGILEPFEDLIFAEIKEPKNWFEGELRWMDKDRKILSFAGYPERNLAINTEQVKVGELKVWKDILQPRWKGKIVLNDPTVAGTGLGWFTDVVKREGGLEFMRELARMEPAITRDQRLQVEWLARGKYAIAISPKPDPVAELSKAGAPIIELSLGGVKLSTGTGQICLINKAPHPQAARLFINWLLSQEAQTAYSKVMGVQSRRLDIPTDHLSPDDIRKAGVQYFMEDEETLLARPAYTKLAQEIFGPLMK